MLLSCALRNRLQTACLAWAPPTACCPPQEATAAAQLAVDVQVATMALGRLMLATLLATHAHHSVLCCITTAEVTIHTTLCLSRPGAEASNNCLPEFTVITDANWWLPCNRSLLVRADAAAAPLTDSTASLDACVQACRRADCHFLNFEYGSNHCWIHEPTNNTGR
jgi:hypothetical protein